MGRETSMYKRTEASRKITEGADRVVKITIFKTFKVSSKWTVFPAFGQITNGKRCR